MLTLNQSRVLERIREQVQNGTKVSVTAAMRGIYSPSTATRPEKITKLPEYQQLLQECLPDELLVRRHAELLDKRKHVRIKNQLIDMGPDTSAVAKALDMAYRLRGKY